MDDVCAIEPLMHQIWLSTGWHNQRMNNEQTSDLDDPSKTASGHLRNLGSGYDCRQRETVANALCHRDDVRRYALQHREVDRSLTTAEQRAQSRQPVSVNSASAKLAALHATTLKVIKGRTRSMVVKNQ